MYAGQPVQSTNLDIAELQGDLFESARIDGTSEFQIFLCFVPSLSKPVLATAALFVAVDAWNAWFDTLFYCSAKPDGSETMLGGVDQVFDRDDLMPEE